MQSRHFLLLWPALLFFILGIASGATAQSFSTNVPVIDGEQCPLPLSTCGPPSLASDATNALDAPIGRCPVGSSCVCVPSCPACDDCAAEVCVRKPVSECRTACDCEPGLGCFEGRCIAGVAPVFCCDSDICPNTQMCQARDGQMGHCSDPMCSERVVKVQKRVWRVVRRASECSVASDCVQIDTSTGCFGTCGAFVNAEHARAVISRIDEIDERLCSGFQEDGCPFVTPSCLATRPACRRGRCAGVPILPGPPLPGLDPASAVAPSDATLHLQAR